MKYDFDQVHERLHTNSLKWDRTETLFGDPDVLPMWLADMDFPCPQPVIDQLLKRAKHGIFGYTIRSEAYFEALLEWMERRHGWSLQKEWIRCTPGVLTALSIIVQTFTEPGDKIIIQPPVYHPFARIVEQNERTLVLNPLQYREGRYEMDFDDLLSKIDSRVKLLILCNPHNPVGRVWTKEELTRLGNICIENDILLVSDEVHGDFVYEGHSFTPFASISAAFAEQSITCTSPSKTFNLAGLQIANIIIPQAQMRRQFTQALNRLHLVSSNTFGLEATEVAYRQGEEWLDQLVAYLQENVLFLTRFMEEKLPEIKVIQPEGTYLVWLDCRHLGLEGREWERFFYHQAKVAIEPGSKFGPGGEGFARINIACPRSLLEEGLNRLAVAVSTRQT